MSDIAQLMRAANPVPDPAAALTHDELNALLLLTRTRSGNMDVKSPETRGRQEKNQHRGWLVAAATFAVILVVAGIGLMVANQSDEDTTVALGLSVVMANYEAFNNGDYDGYLATFTDELAQEQPRIEGWRVDNEQIEIVEPCRVVETSPTGDTTVECSTTRSNDYLGPAGIIENVTETFVANGDGKISSVENDGPCCIAQWRAFNQGFWQWLQVAYPAVFEEIRPIDFDSFPGWQRDPADMLIAIQYVEEFVAQSDDYPINP